MPITWSFHDFSMIIVVLISIKKLIKLRPKLLKIHKYKIDGFA